MKRLALHVGNCLQKCQNSYESSTVTLISSANENNILHDQNRTLVHICTCLNWQRGIYWGLNCHLTNMYRKVHQFWPFLRKTRLRNGYTNILKHIDNRRFLLFLSRLVLIWLQWMQNVIVDFFDCMTLYKFSSNNQIWSWLEAENFCSGEQKAKTAYFLQFLLSIDKFLYMNFFNDFKLSSKYCVCWYPMNFYSQFSTSGKLEVVKLAVP
jgi:hypothetical protein